MPAYLWKGITLLGAAAAGIFSAVAFRDSRRFVRQEYYIQSDKISKDTVIVLLSDLHNKQYGRKNERLIETIRNENPDLILVAGDIMTSDGKKTRLDIALHLMEQLSREFPIYYGNGNHEYRMKMYPNLYGSRYEYYQDRLKEMGVRVLDNKKIELQDRNMEIFGLELKKLYYKRFIQQKMDEHYMEEVLGRVNPDKFGLLIAHNPDYFPDYAKWGADLTVSGHVHGGVIKLPLIGGVISPMMRLFPKYDGGLFCQGDKTLVLSRGLGMHTVPIRIFNPGELVVIRIERRMDNGNTR